MDYPTFEAWMKQVNKLIVQTTGCFDSNDFVDISYHIMYDDGLPPEEAIVELAEQDCMFGQWLYGE